MTDLDDIHPTRNIFTQVLNVLASVRITVVLLTLGLLLVFVGTLAQTKLGVWVVIHDYFRSLVVWVPMNMFPDLIEPSDARQYDEGNFFPMPGGFTILALLCVNLFASLLKIIIRDVRLGKRRWLSHVGVYTIHVGLVVMFGGEFITGLYATESQMAVRVGESSSYAEDVRVTELAFVRVTDTGQEEHLVIPQAMLVKHAGHQGDGQVIHSPELPVDVHVQRFMVNSLLEQDLQPTGFIGAGQGVKATPLPPISGSDVNKINYPSIVVTLLDKQNGELLGQWLCSTMSQSTIIFKYQGRPAPGIFLPQPLDLPGESVTMHLRYARRYLPYAVALDDLDHDVYEGTRQARNYSSDVRMLDPKTGSEVSAHIKMNHPMRYQGDTYYQQQMMAQLNVSVFQVVNNPGAWLPYISCAIVTLGLILQFTMSLTKFTRRASR